ncbi:MAG: hypothetical protein MPW14_09630 [Candidatus Manganitrophus sp.]|nr:MAG: hypothetical protein MPW14_09630 [Candidatus Manganitrophus sp.]
MKVLTERAERFLKKMLSCGTTTVEVKSGYGLDLQNELKILKVIERLADRLPLELVPTFMGAHAVPKEYSKRPEAYVNQVIKMLPSVRRRARFCDVFCEEGAFNYYQTRRILEAARREGFAIKLHVGEFSDQGGCGWRRSSGRSRSIISITSALMRYPSWPKAAQSACCCRGFLIF